MLDRARALRRRELLAGALLGAGATMGACARADDRDRRGRLRLSFWTGFTGGDGPPMRRLVERFDREHADIAVRMITVRWDDLYRRLPLLRFGGRGPDVGVVHQHRLPSLAARGVIAPIDALVDRFGLDEASFDPTAWRAGVWSGHRYAVPLDLHPLGMYARVDALRRAGIDALPATGDALEDVLSRLARAGFERPLWMPTAWPAHLVFESLLWQHGGAPFTEDGASVTIATDAGAAAIAWMRGLVDRGYSPRSVGVDAPWNAFLNGSNAITFDGSWMLESAKAVPGGVMVAPFPRIGPTPAVWANGHQLVLFRGVAEHRDRIDASMAFITWLSEASLAWAEAGQIPARTSVRRTAAFRALGPIATLARQLPDVHLVPSAVGVGELQDDAIPFAVSSALRARSPRDALVEAEALANDELRAMRASFGGYT